MEDHSIPLDVIFPDKGEGAAVAVEDETLPTVEEVVPQYPDAKPNFYKASKLVSESFQSTMMVECLAKFKARVGLPGHVELVPAGDDEVRVHRPGFCTLYVDLFIISYMFPLSPLIEELCSYYNIFPV